MQQVVLLMTAHQEGCLDAIATSLESIAKSLETLRCNATPKDGWAKRQDKENK